METEPRPDRPDMRMYGVPDAPEGMLPWSWARERLEAAHNYWLATTRPDGRPHVAAVWGHWFEGAFWFSTAVTSRKALNLRSDARCTVTTERADEAVILEGTAEPARDRDAVVRFVAVYNKKYNWDMDPDAQGYYVVRPRVAFGFIEHAGQFAQTATRWRFDA
jgi:hypothetical protein